MSKQTYSQDADKGSNMEDSKAVESKKVDISSVQSKSSKDEPAEFTAIKSATKKNSTNQTQEGEPLQKLKSQHAKEQTKQTEENKKKHKLSESFTEKFTAAKAQLESMGNKSDVLGKGDGETTKKNQFIQKQSEKTVDTALDGTLDKEIDKTKLRIVTLGGGSFGTAMANMAARNGCNSTLWVRNKRAVKQMQKKGINKKYLPDHKLHDALQFTNDLAEAVKYKDIIFVAVPSHAFRDVLKQIAPLITAQAVVSLTKGIEKESFALMSDIIQDELPSVPFGVISGPNLAKEIMNNMPAGTVIASDSEPLRHAVQAGLHSALFRVFASSDVLGVELGGALKNIYAIAMGMAAAYKVGENTRSMLITRALAEMSRFAVAMGANPLTFLGLSGVGDLFATCNSPLSRNYQVGNMLGKGYTLEKAVKKLGQTAEGINTIAQVRAKSAELGIYMPITHALYEIIYEQKAPLGVALTLMQAGNRSDVEFVLPHSEV